MDNFLKAVMLRDVEGIPPTRSSALPRLTEPATTWCCRWPATCRPWASAGRDCDVIGAEILYAARREMAVKLGDALIRRTEAGAAGHPGADALERAAAIMARAHEWDEWRMRNEIAEVEAFYRLPRD